RKPVCALGHRRLRRLATDIYARALHAGHLRICRFDTCRMAQGLGRRAACVFVFRARKTAVEADSATPRRRDPRWSPNMNIHPLFPANATERMDQRLHAAVARATSSISPTLLLLSYIDWATHLAVAPGK